MGVLFVCFSGRGKVAPGMRFVGVGGPEGSGENVLVDVVHGEVVGKWSAYGVVAEAEVCQS
jgi:hypothetical protein